MNEKEVLFLLSDCFLEENDEEFGELDFSKLFGEIVLNRVEGMAYQNLEKMKKVKFPKVFKNALKKLYYQNCVLTEEYICSLKYLASILKGATFNYALLKGAVLNTLLYQKGLRLSNDIDILIAECDIDKCQKLLINNGFVQGEYKEGEGIIQATRKDVIMSRMNYGETIPFLKIYNNDIIMVDINFSLDYKPQKGHRIVESMLQEKRKIQLEEYNFFSLCKEDFFIHLCCHLFKEATTINWVKDKRDLMLYKFSDINLCLHTFMSEKIVSQIVFKSERNGLQKEVYYTIKNTQEIFPTLRNNRYANFILDSLSIDDISFMKAIYNTDDRKSYFYTCDFREWFMNDNRYQSLIGGE